MPSSKPEDGLDALFRNLTQHERERGAVPGPVDGTTFGGGRYELQGMLGEGATAIVYRACDRQLNRPVALKVLRESGALSPVARERFRREAQTAANLSHPNLIAVYDAGEERGSLYLVMELVEGRSLAEVMRDEGASVEKLVPLVERAALGVGAAHAKGVIHRDLKPANILVSSTGEPKVGDFGLAHLMESTTVLTRTGTTLGTPLYMSPEQASGRSKDLSVRTDVYALGGILYEILTGRAPHFGETATDMYRKIVELDVVPARKIKAGIPRDLETIAQKALERDPEKRYPTAEAFAEDLERYRKSEPVLACAPGMLETLLRRLRRRPALGAAFLAAGMVLAAAAGYSLWKEGRRDDEERRYEDARRKGDELWAKAAALARTGAPSRETLLRAATEALRQFSVAAAARRSEAYPHLMKGRCFLLLGEGSEAERAWTEALRLRPGYGPALFERGKYTLGIYAEERVLRRAGPGRALAGSEEPSRRQWRERGRADLEAARSSPELEKPLLGCLEGMLLLGQGEFRKAADALASYVGDAPWDVDALALLGATYYYSGCWSDAEQSLTRALAMGSAARWRKWRGDARTMGGRFREAIEDYTEALKEDPGNAGILCNRALARQALGETSEALSDYTLALERSPQFARAYNSRGTLWYEQLEFRKALKDFEEAANQSELDPEIHSNLAKTWLMLGDADAAVRELEISVGLDPGDPESRFLLALARKQKGEISQALAELRRSLEMGPPSWVRRPEAERLLRDWGGK
jgi:tetratricopeptide (TPR) repeat protein/tRNA A-37 threonylcarbamoyl transferase component Bud32